MVYADAIVVLDAWPIFIRASVKADLYGYYIKHNVQFDFLSVHWSIKSENIQRFKMFNLKLTLRTATKPWLLFLNVAVVNVVVLFIPYMQKDVLICLVLNCFIKFLR